MTEIPTGEGELFIDLNLGGLAALLKAVESAMVEGRGRLTLRTGSGVTVTCAGSPDRLRRVTVTFTDADDPSDDAGEAGRPDPEPLPRMPVLETQS